VKSIVKPDRPLITIWRMRIACRIPESTNKDSEYVILVAYILQQWLGERASLLRCTHNVCLVLLLSALVISR
jgi:hypothetical protein